LSGLDPAVSIVGYLLEVIFSWGKVYINRLRWQRTGISILIVTTKPQPESKTTTITPEPKFGWNVYAEQINGRFAMMGFVLLLLLELVTGQDLLTWLGLR
jgi:Chlorophyll A-B binding protein